MTYALIGCGRISTNHMKAALESKLEIIAVCDLVPERIDQLLKSHRIENDSQIFRYTDYQKMINECKPDLVAIATESGYHAEIALACIDAGCHLIIEKPIALSLADADQIIKRGRSKGVFICACHQNRFNVAIQNIRHAMDEGRFGKLSHGSVHVRWNRNKEYYDQAPWRGTWNLDGGVLMNQSIHGIDLLRWLMGDEIEEVFAYTARRFHAYIECEDVGIAVVKFKNGALGTIEGTTNVYPKNLEEALYIYGERGTVKAGGNSANSIQIWQFSDSRPEDRQFQTGFEEPVANVYGNGHLAVYNNMITSIENKIKPYIDAEAGRRALELVLAIYKSAKEKRPICLPLEDCSTKDFIY